MKTKTATKTTEAATHTKEDTTMKTKTTAKTTNAATPTKEDATMKTIATTQKQAAASTPPASDIALQLQALEEACGYGDPLPDATRKVSEDLFRRVPTTIVDRVLALAVRGGGVVAGIKLDPTAAKGALAAADDADAVATAAQMLARRAQDQSIRLRAGVTGNVSAIRTSLRGFVKTAQGASLAQENDEIKSLAKQHRAAAKGRATRAANAAKVAAEGSAPATAGGEGAVETEGGATAVAAVPLPVVKTS